MIPSLTALLKTVTGKTLAGVIVATMGVGAAAAADVQVGILMSDDDQGADVQDAEHEDAEHEDADPDPKQEDSEEGTEDAGAEDGDDSSTAAFASEVEGSEDADALEDDAEENHGTVVSEFTQSAADLGLTGCAKGQATAAVARRDVIPGDAADEAALLEALAPFVEKCGVDLLAEDDPEIDPEAELDGDEDGDWKATRDGDLDVARKEAQAAFDELCGDDDESEGSEGTDGDDDEMSEECRILKQAAKDAHNEWKDAWKSERDEEHADRKADKPAKAEQQDKGNQGKSGSAPGKNK